MKEMFREYMDQFWVSQEDNIFTIGLTEESLDEIDQITRIELPEDGDIADKEVAIGVIHTKTGQIEIYAPVNGQIVEVNSTVLEDPSLVQDDPYDSWLVRIESEESLSDEDEEDEDFDDEDDEDEDLEEDDEDFDDEDED